MIELLGLWCVIFLLLTGPGLLVLLFGLGRRYSTSLEFYILGPAAGLVVAIPCCSIATLFGLKCSLALASITVLAWLFLTGWSLAFLRSSRIQISKLFLSFFAFLIANCSTSVDILQFGLHEYFPLTNDDTFSYLGLMDQVRTVAKFAPTLTYANGLSPFIEHAIVLRGGVTAFAAGLADLLNLQSYEAFFLLLRTSAAINLTVLLALTIFLKIKPQLILLTLILIVSGNFFMHQVLQQFLSSMIGAVLAAFSLAITAFLSKKAAKRTYILLGASVGSAFIASPEAGPFYLACFGIIVITAGFFLRRRETIPQAIVSCCAGFLISTNILLVETVKAIASQALQYSSGHPGDRFAVASSIIQFTGVDLVGAQALSWFVIFASVAVCAAVVLFAVWSTSHLATTIRLNDRSDQALLPLLIYTVCGSFMLATMFAARKGYGYLKLMEYFDVIVPVVFIGLAFLLSGRGFSRRIAARFLIVTFVACISMIYAMGRQRLYSTYQNELEARGTLAAFTAKLPSSCSEAPVVIPDGSGMPLELAAYMNSGLPSLFILYPTNSVRFRMVGTRPFPQYVLMGASKMTTDVNRPAMAGFDEAARLFMIDGYINVGSGGSGWHLPEGSPDPLRWMSSRATFDVFFQHANDMFLHFYVHDAGPDMKAGETIEVIFGETIVARFGAVEFLGEHLIRLPVQNGPKIVHAEMRVGGEATGSRHFRIGRLFMINAQTGDALPNDLKGCRP